MSPLGHLVAEREKPDLQPLVEHEKPDGDQRHAHRQAPGIGQRLAQDDEAGKQDDGDDRQQVPDHDREIDQHLDRRVLVLVVARHHDHRDAVLGGNEEDDAVDLDDDHRRQRAEGDQPEAVEHRIASADAGRQADAERSEQRRGDGRGDDATRIEGQPDQLRRRKHGEGDDDQVTGNQVVADRMAEDDAPDADHHRQADAERGDHAQGQRRHAAARNRFGLVGDGHQRRLGGDRGEADAEGEQHQPEKGTAAGEVEGHRLAGREDRRVQTLDEQRQADEDDGEAADQRDRAVRHALDEEHLEDDDDDQRRGQVARRFVQKLADDAEQGTEAHASARGNRATAATPATRRQGCDGACSAVRQKCEKSLFP